MKISFLNPQNHINKLPSRQTCPNLLYQKNSVNFTPLNQDTVSFKGNKNIVKKSDFKGIDFSVTEKYRVDISKFRSTDDLQTWAKEKVEEISKKDLGGRQQETKIQRKAIFNEWLEYITKENDAYTPVMQLEILSAITKTLKPNTDDIPPVLNKGVLADTMNEYTNRLNENPKENINLNKLYKTKLNETYFKTDGKEKNSSDFTGWIVIPSKTQNPEHFGENVEKLKALSHKNWCTKSFNAEPYLSEGEFHVYLEKGLPKLGVRFVGNEIEEIQGEKNNTKIPQKYLKTAEQHIEQNKFKLRTTAKNEVEQAENLKIIIKKVRTELGKDAVKSSNPEVILPYFDIDVKKDKDGKLIIDSYKQPTNNFTYEDLGIDENKLLKNVKEVRIGMDLTNSKATNLENIEYIGGCLDCNERKDLNFKNLKRAGSIDCRHTNNINFDSLERIDNFADFKFCKNINLEKLKYINQKANFQSSFIKNLDALISCKDLFIDFSDIESMKSLETVKGDLCINTKIKSFENLKDVKGRFIIPTDSELESLPKLETVGELFEINGQKIKKLNSLRHVRGYLSIRSLSLDEMKNLETVGDSVWLEDSPIVSLPKLKHVGKDFFATALSKLTALESLETVGRDFSSVHNNLSDLHNLRHVGNTLILYNTKVSDLNNLEYVGRNADFKNTPVEKLEKLKKVGGFLNLHGTKIPNPGDYKTLCHSPILLYT